MHLRTQHELEIARRLCQQVSQQTSSIPLSSRTSETGWEHIGSTKALPVSVGAAVRSPEINTPNHRSPSNRDKIVTEEQPAPVQAVQDVNMGYTRDPSLLSSTSPLQKPVQSSSSGMTMRNAQLHGLLRSLGMTGRSSSSSSTSKTFRKKMMMRPMTG